MGSPAQESNQYRTRTVSDGHHPLHRALATADPEWWGGARRAADALAVSVIEPTPGTTGQGRTALATDGADQLVIKWGDQEWGEGVRRALAHLNVLLNRGWPGPRVISCACTADGGFSYAIEQISGSPASDGLTDAVLTDVLAAIEIQASADDRGNGWSWVDACVYDDHIGWWAAVQDAAQPIARRALAWTCAKRAEPVWDYVHLDLNVGNVMTDRGRLVAIIDVDHLTLGDRLIDIAALAFDAARLGMPVLGQIVAAGVALGGDARWRRAVAYNTSAKLGWSPAADRWAAAVGAVLDASGA